MEDVNLTWEEPLSPKEIIEDELVKKYKKDKFYVLYSGGKDSGCVDDFIAKNYPEYYAGRVFTNTGISSTITRKFALDYSAELNRPITMTWARKNYKDIILEKGFPGPGSHRIIMGYLKFHSWYYFMKDKKLKGENACFISGVRKKESWARDKRKFYTKKPIDVNTGIAFCKPFLYKNGQQLVEYFIKNGVKKSPAYEYFDKSGECWCGCFYNEWELKMIETYDPFLFQTIKWLEKQIQLHGSVEAKKHPHWGRSVGADLSELQTTLMSFNEDYCGESCQVEN